MILREPHATRLRELIIEGAVVQDIHDAPGAGAYAAPTASISEAYIQRELNRVLAHSTSNVPVLERYVGRAPRILDVGCSSGGTAVALALSKVLAPDALTAVDPNARALEAARVRALAHGLDEARIRFQHIVPGAPLPFGDGEFDLTTCISVLEFVSEAASREALVRELVRVTRSGGHVFLATPTPWRLTEYHSGRLLGDYRRRAGFPWSSSPAAVRRMFRGCTAVPIAAGVLDVGLSKRFPNRPAFVAPAFAWAVPMLRWSKQLFRKG